MTPMRVLVAHNAYQIRGGEDSVVASELALLREHGHDVVEYMRHNDDVRSIGKLRLAKSTLWSTETTAEIDSLVERARPDIIHVHNTLPLISPSIYWAAHRHGIPVVQTLHNFRLLCPQGLLLRDQKVCEDCVGHVPWRAVSYGCYRNSAVQSAVVAATVSLHRGLGTFANRVSRYIALNRFCRDKFVQGGLPSQRMRIKPNFVDVPGAAPDGPRDGGLFVGRLSNEKGIDVLARALPHCPGVRMLVAGAGEAEDENKARSAFGSSLLGKKTLDEILGLMRHSRYLVVPSIWYENFPRTIVEAYACGLPVIASRIGALSEIVVEGETGLLFEPGSAEDLARQLRWAHQHPAEMSQMGKKARLYYERYYTAQRNYEMLIDIYADASESQRVSA